VFCPEKKLTTIKTKKGNTKARLKLQARLSKYSEPPHRQVGIPKQITIKNSAVKALEYLKQVPPDKFPDYILLDISMPQMDGFTFLNEFAKLSPEVKVKSKIVMLTSSEDKNDRERAERNPYITKYLQKPISGYTLKEIFE
jgi:CheY-like chemotaxis protein